MQHYHTPEAAERNAPTQCGHGCLIGQHPDSGRVIVIPMCCKKWTCPQCAPRLAASWNARIAAANPERLITLTVKPDWHKGPLAAYKAIEKAWHQFVTMWRKGALKNNGKIKRPPHPIEYVLIWELQGNGFPHAHILQKGHYVPQKFLARFMEVRRVGFIQDIRRVDGPERAAQELTKYLVKTAGDTAAWLGKNRLVRSSQHFFPPSPPRDQQRATAGYDWVWVPTSPQIVLEHLINHRGFEIDRDFFPDQVELAAGPDAITLDVIAYELDPRPPPDETPDLNGPWPPSSTAALPAAAETLYDTA